MPRFPLKTFQQDAILKRLSMGLVALETTNIKTLSDSELDKLQCGDVVVKKTGEQEHAYVVSYKQDRHGICLTYSDASCIETVSYDYTNSHWVYNSTDVFNVAYQEVANINLDNGWLNGLTARNVYGKVVKENNILFVVLSFQLANETESAIETPTNAPIASFTVPESIGDKIYRKDGTKVSEAYTSGDDITALSLKLSNSAGGLESRICNLYSSMSNYLAIWASGNTSAVELNAGNTLNVDLRFFLVL